MATLQKTEWIGRSLLHVAQLYLYTIVADILLSELSFILGRAISWYTLPISFLIGMICLVLFYGDNPGKIAFCEVAVSILLFVFFAGLCGKIYDLSWDGNIYHKLAVGLLKNHWNPLLQLPQEAAVEILNFYVEAIGAECYAKGVWILAAGIYGITGNIECGKVYTLISMICAFGLTYYCMRTHKKSTLFAVAFSLVAALNPIALRQMTTFYVDGYLQVMLYILVLSLAMLVSKGEDRTIRLVFSSITACAMVICGTTKFTGLLYGGVYCITYFIYYCYIQERTKNERRQANIRKCFCRFATLAAVTVLWAGVDTYVMNTIRHGSPLYPLYGADALDIITLNSPFGEVNHVKNLFISLFSKMDNLHFHLGRAPTLKIPFTIDWQTELFPAIWCYDTRISGFGVLFSGIFIIAIFVIIIKLGMAAKVRVGKKQTRNRPEIQFWILLLLTNIGLCLAITESWWARYAPYIYFTVLMGTFFLWDISCTEKLRYPVKCLKVILLVLFLGNNLINVARLPSELQQSTIIRNEMYNLRGFQEVEIGTAEFHGVYFNFEDQRVHYTPNYDLLENGLGTAFPYMIMQVYVK